MKRTNFYLTEKQVAGLKALASKTGLKFSEHIRRAIDKYLKEEGTDEQ